MRLEAAIKGNLHKFMEQQKAAAETAVTAGVAEITDRIKNDLRQQVAGSGLGARLAKSWQAKLYPKGKKSMDAAGWVFSKAPKIIRAFNDGALIKSKNGFFLAIPTEAAPKRGVGGKRINPSNFPEHSLGRLRFVYRPGKISLLVVDNLRAGTGKRGGFSQGQRFRFEIWSRAYHCGDVLPRPASATQETAGLPIGHQPLGATLPQTILKHWPQEKGNDEQT